MTYEQIQTMLETAVDDTMDSVLEQQLINEECDMLLSERDWEFLKGLDETQTFNSGDTYLTTHPLPSDYGRPSDKGIFLGTDLIPYSMIPFEQRIRWKDITYRYYVDNANGVYAIMGTSQSGTIHFYYIKVALPISPKINGSVPSGYTNSPIFPSRFHPILAYGVARKYFAVDQGDKSRAWDDRWDKYYTRMHDEMVLWDESLKSLSNQNAYLPVDLNSYPNIIDIDQP